MDGLFAADLLVRSLSDRLTGQLTLKNGPPGYDAETRTLSVPAWPTEDFPPDELRRLRAFLSHESARHGQQTWKHTEGPWKDKPGYTQLVTGLTAPVYDAQLAEDFPGAGMNIQATLREQAQYIEQLNQKQPFEPSVAMLGTLLRLQQSGVYTPAELASKFPQFQPMLQKVAPLMQQVARTEQDALAQATAVYRQLQVTEPPPPPKQQPQEGQQGQPCEGEGQGEPAEGEQPNDATGQNQQANGKGGSPPPPQQQSEPKAGQGKPEKKEEQHKPEQPGEAPQDQTPAQAKAKKAKPAPDTAKTDYNLDQQILQDSLKGGGAWPNTRGDGRYTYSTQWDSWEDLPAKHKHVRKAAMKPALRRNAQVLGTVLRRALQTEAMHLQRRQVRGSLDTTRLVPLVTGRSTAIMKRRRLQPGINVAVSVSLDASGSMGSDWSLAKDTLQVLNGALASIQVPTEILTWTTGHDYRQGPPDYKGLYRQEPMRFELVKGFHHVGTDPSVISALQGMNYYGSTPTGEGLHRAAERLAARPEQRKVLFLVTDGMPGFQHNGPEEVHRRFIQRTLDQCAKAGIEVIGIGLGVKINTLIPRSMAILNAGQLGPIFQGEIMRVLRDARKLHAAKAVA